jgi:hypothetical protein
LNKRDGASYASRVMSPLPPPRGILRAPRPDGLLDVRRLTPSPRLAPYIHHYWAIRWSLRSPFKGESLPHPSVQILRIASCAERSAFVLGVRSGALARTLTDDGETFGVTFRTVMFQALLGAPMESITDRVVPLEHVLGASARPWARAIDAARAPEEKVALTEALLRPLLTPSPRLERIRDLVERIAVDRSILRVDDIARANGLGTRALPTLLPNVRWHFGEVRHPALPAPRSGHPTPRAASALARRARGVPRLRRSGALRTRLQTHRGPSPAGVRPESGFVSVEH